MATRGVEREVADIVLGRKHHGHHLLLHHPQVDTEVVAVPAEHLRIDHLGPVRNLVAVIVLDAGQRSLKRRAGEEGRPDPIVHQAAGNSRVAVAHERLGDDLARADRLQPIWRIRGPEETLPVQPAVNAGLGGADIAVEGVDRLLFQLRGAGRDGQRHPQGQQRRTRQQWATGGPGSRGTAQPQGALVHRRAFPGWSSGERAAAGFGPNHRFVLSRTRC